LFGNLDLLADCSFVRMPSLGVFEFVLFCAHCYPLNYLTLTSTL
jgi:hypothetical protein